MLVISECSAIWRINHVQGLPQKITTGFEEYSGYSDHCIWSPTWWRHKSKCMINDFPCEFLSKLTILHLWFQSQPIEVNVVSHPIQRFAVWFGGSVLASTPEFYGVFLIIISKILVSVEFWIAKGKMIKYWTSDWWLVEATLHMFITDWSIEYRCNLKLELNLGVFNFCFSPTSIELKFNYKGFEDISKVIYVRSLLFFLKLAA